MSTHYEILGVERTASTEEIAKAYLRRTSGSRKAGFLRGGTQSRHDRQAIEEAYEVLIDRRKREDYDRTIGPPGT